jgi:outer membrane protein OmpA-like peptidoglycan-associated protein
MKQGWKDKLMRGNPMRTSRQVLSVFVLSLAFLLLGAAPLLAKCAHLKLHVTPKEAYVFVDGMPLGPGSGVIWAEPGEHTLAVYNYGFKPYTSKFTAESGKTTALSVALEAIPGTNPGPWGRIELKGQLGAAVLLNGTTPDFFVGNVGESVGGKKRLLVPPGDYQLTVLGCCSGTIYSGPITVGEGQATIIPLPNPGGKTTSDFAAGKTLGALPRFQSAGASVTVAVAKPTAQINAASGTVDCGASTQLNWSTTDAPKVELSGTGGVAASGQQSVQPSQNTDYKLTATGPGGVVSADATVNVNSNIQSTLTAEPGQVRYHKVGDRVEEQGSATLTWSAPGANATSLDPFGSVSPNGTRTVQPTPTRTEPGPVDETITYTLRSSNACGGADTKTASVHLVGSIEAARAAVSETTLATKLALNSIYFPYDLPSRADPQGGLVPGEAKRALDVADTFKQYLQIRPEAHLILEAHCDHRGSVEYNKELSERRADRVKNYLVENGVAAANIETRALGKEQNLSNKQVLELLEQDPNVTPQERKLVRRNLATFRMANNRRVDIRLSTTGQSSLRYFPYNSDDLKVLLGERKPRSKK